MSLAWRSLIGRASLTRNRISKGQLSTTSLVIAKQRRPRHRGGNLPSKHQDQLEESQTGIYSTHAMGTLGVQQAATSVATPVVTVGMAMEEV